MYCNKQMVFQSKKLSFQMIMLFLLLTCVTKAQVNTEKSKSQNYISENSSNLPVRNETDNKTDAANKTKSVPQNKTPLKKAAVANADDYTDKPHFVLYLNENSKQFEEIYRKALNQFIRIESYRLINGRRTIQLANGIGRVELYSANELLSLYGRRIRPQNVNDASKLLDIELVFGENGTIKEQLIRR